MNTKHMQVFFIFPVLILVLAACNIPAGNTDTGNPQATSVAGTLSALQTGMAGQSATPAAIKTSTPVPTPTETGLPSATPTPQNPLVLRDTLCWVGPGAIYEVVSSLKKDARVELLGRGSIEGWWIVRNPIYNDECWVQASDLQLDASYYTADLKTFYPPPTPTPTITSTPTATVTPRP